MCENIEEVAKQAQRYYGLFPTLILGSGASAAFGMSGMGALAAYLIKNVVVDDAGHLAAWEVFCKDLESGMDLESALHKNDLPEEVTRNIVFSTWMHLCPQDLDIFNNGLDTHDEYPLCTLLKHMLRSTQGKVNIITTNYDRIAEYACEQARIHHYTGFAHGFRRFQADSNYLICQRQVNIWKVHGSLDWFLSSSGEICALGNSEKIPNNYIPLIVTPGIAKYRSTHKEPYKTIIHEADNILDSASAYLCIGYGFNDEHIQEKLVNKCVSKGSKLIIITHKLTDSTRRILFQGRIKEFIAIESGSHENESYIYTSNEESMLRVDADYWSLDGFLKLIM
ncbi:SIR2 family protein [Serratia liquefaciens]|uniref:SIR2 family protein n=1 Tax=Serratia liquefaciens TaxID=614 RepID=UPI0018D69CB9|nr:SIR2 family protein [Serratia liquefaciens]